MKTVASTGDCDFDIELAKGDKVWWIPGHHGTYLIAILCTVTKVDRTFRKRSPQGYLFYDLDEPVGHSVRVSDVFFTREEVTKFLKKREKATGGKAKTRDLATYRRKARKFILSTWGEHGKNAPPWKWPRKKRGVEWFSLADVK